MSDFKPSYDKYTTSDAIKTELIIKIATHINTLLATPYENIVWSEIINNEKGLSSCTKTTTIANVWINTFWVNPFTYENTPCIFCRFCNKEEHDQQIFDGIKNIFAELNPRLTVNGSDCKKGTLIIPFPTKAVLDGILAKEKKGATEALLQTSAQQDGVFDCSGKGLTELPPFPENATFTNFYCNLNKLTHLPDIPQTVTYMLICNNKLNSLPKLPYNLERLNCDDNELQSLPKLPSTLKILSCENNKLEYLPELPESLIELRCYGNEKLKCLPDLPEGLKVLSFINKASLEVRYPALHWLNTMKEKIAYVNKVNALVNAFYCNLRTQPLLLPTTYTPKNDAIVASSSSQQ